MRETAIRLSKWCGPSKLCIKTGTILYHSFGLQTQDVFSGDVLIPNEAILIATFPHLQPAQVSRGESVWQHIANWLNIPIRAQGVFGQLASIDKGQFRVFASTSSL
jgi:hypothetical protein